MPIGHWAAGRTGTSAAVGSFMTRNGSGEAALSNARCTLPSGAAPTPLSASPDSARRTPGAQLGYAGRPLPRRKNHGRHHQSQQAPQAEGAHRSRAAGGRQSRALRRSEEHTSELQSLMRISYAVFCLKKKKITTHNTPARKTTNSQAHITND